MTEAELGAAVPLMVGSGAASLGWWKIRHTAHADSAHAQTLREVYRFQTLQSALHERHIERVFTLLDAAGVEAILIKGLASARLYTERGLRPYGDIDVCVPEAQFALASHALEGPEARGCWVDLHAGMGKSDGGSFEELAGRAVVLKVGGARVRVLAPEDHLRLVCVHLLRHGAWRPLWLCDAGAALEGRDAGFDWARLLGADKRRARWVECAVGLAHKLLDARVDDTPFASAAERLPRWLLPGVLKQWETPYPAMQAPMRHAAPMRAYLRRPSGVFGDLLNRWPNPIEATVSVSGPFNELPRWPFQVANCVTRASRLFRQNRLPQAGGY
ncbi:MAG: nucleotidyltransferase family protein [Acidobacteria bacterium]|nr:nucleotidyltransferase family protein [Acidobacteriota bacterium]